MNKKMNEEKPLAENDVIGSILVEWASVEAIEADDVFGSMQVDWASDTALNLHPLFVDCSKSFDVESEE